jgi:hypothetical protein
VEFESRISSILLTRQIIKEICIDFFFFSIIFFIGNYQLKLSIIVSIRNYPTEYFFVSVFIVIYQFFNNKHVVRWMERAVKVARIVVSLGTINNIVKLLMGLSCGWVESIYKKIRGLHGEGVFSFVV